MECTLQLYTLNAALANQVSVPATCGFVLHGMRLENDKIEVSQEEISTRFLLVVNYKLLRTCIQNFGLKSLAKFSAGDVLQF